MPSSQTASAGAPMMARACSVVIPRVTLCAGLRFWLKRGTLAHAARIPAQASTTPSRLIRHLPFPAHPASLQYRESIERLEITIEGHGLGRAQRPIDPTDQGIGESRLGGSE